MGYPLVRDLAAEGIPVRMTCGVLRHWAQAYYACLTVPGNPARPRRRAPDERADRRARRRPRVRLPVPDRRARTRRACCRQASCLALVLAAEAVVSHDAQGPGQRQDAWPGGARRPRSARLHRCGAEHGLGHGHQRAPYGLDSSSPRNGRPMRLSVKQPVARLGCPSPADCEGALPDDPGGP